MLLLESISHQIITFIQLHQAWGMPIVFLLAFGESLVFISLLLPATFILLALSMVIAPSHLAFTPLFIAAVCGAFVGDWLSFELGYRYEQQLLQHRWLQKYPRFIDRAHHFFIRFGFWGVFIGRFFGPLRAFVPIIAGAARMNPCVFQVANLFSAVIWGFGILAPGAFGLPWLRSLF